MVKKALKRVKLDVLSPRSWLRDLISGGDQAAAISLPCCLSFLPMEKGKKRKPGNEADVVVVVVLS